MIAAEPHDSTAAGSRSSTVAPFSSPIELPSLRD
jgi:hypothetical protein